MQIKCKLLNNKMSIKILSALSENSYKTTVMPIKFCPAYNVFLLIELHVI